MGNQDDISNGGAARCSRSLTGSLDIVPSSDREDGDIELARKNGIIRTTAPTVEIAIAASKLAGSAAYLFQENPALRRVVIDL